MHLRMFTKIRGCHGHWQGGYSMTFLTTENKGLSYHNYKK